MNEHVRAFLDYLKYEKNYSDRTIGSYADDLRRFEQFCTDELGSFDPLTPQLDVARGWMAQTIGVSGLTSSRKNRIAGTSVSGWSTLLGRCIVIAT